MLPNRLLRARRLFIRNVTITAPIGAYEHEKKAPQRLILSCDVWVPDTPVCRDSLDEVLNYDQIVDVLKSTALARHHDLQETLVAEIAERLSQLPGVLAVRIASEKPDAYEEVEAAGRKLRTSASNARERCTANS